jgi:hypothetical protein
MKLHQNSPPGTRRISQCQRCMGHLNKKGQDNGERSGRERREVESSRDCVITVFLHLGLIRLVASLVRQYGVYLQ